MALLCLTWQVDALNRLEKQGIVHMRTVGRVHLYEFNRDHVAADAVIAAMGY